MHTFMIVDDNDHMRGLIHLLLLETFRGCTVLEAATGFEFLGLLPRTRPDLILMDVRLPDSSGISLYTILRQNPTLGRLPVLFVTANAERVWQEDLEGPYTCLLKPFGLDEFLHAVCTLIGAPAGVQAMTG